MVYDTQVRATFNDTKLSQERLRQQLDKYDENSIPVANSDRKVFFDLLADALLGLDYEKSCIIRLPDTNTFYIKNVGEFLRYLCYYEKNMIDDTFLDRYQIKCKELFNIGYLWHEIKFVIFGIYPEALTVSIRISKEREKREKSEGASLEQIQRPAKY